MTDREKAIRILEGSYKDFVLRHNGELLTVNKLIALLKEQEPKLVRYTASTVRCPNCNKQITTKGCIHREINYCWKCGQAVKWDETDSLTSEGGK